ncbi:MAG: MerR family transcriptional regulator, heat shock protein HspR [Nocardioidaceae bacterium]|jgi:DNA-binding transcriptional MerR regulator|nr:MerR family transcriptional regulator, heat shock protein HspR [Nocardioidaceae bacterium]
MPEQADRRGLYGMSVAAELTGVAPQNLRFYEARGLLEPHRTPGGTRRYSEHDLARVARIIGLLEAGLNLKGIEHVLALEAETEQLRRELAALGPEAAIGPDEAIRPDQEGDGQPAPRRRRHGSGPA